MVINYMLNRNIMIVHLIAGLIKKIWCDYNDCNCTKNEEIFS